MTVATSSLMCTNLMVAFMYTLISNLVGGHYVQQDIYNLFFTRIVCWRILMSIQFVPFPSRSSYCSDRFCTFVVFILFYN